MAKALSTTLLHISLRHHGQAKEKFSQKEKTDHRQMQALAGSSAFFSAVDTG
jgi:hypothetical protein